MHVRRKGPNNNSPGWFYMVAEDAKIISDVFEGKTVSVSLNEMKSFYSNKMLTLAQSGQYVRYFKPWAISQYLIVTGDHSKWISFTAGALHNLKTLVSSEITFPNCFDLEVTSHLNSAPHNIQALFLKSNSDVILNFLEGYCPPINVVLHK